VIRPWPHSFPNIRAGSRRPTLLCEHRCRRHPWTRQAVDAVTALVQTLPGFTRCRRRRQEANANRRM